MSLMKAGADTWFRARAGSRRWRPRSGRLCPVPAAAEAVSRSTRLATRRTPMTTQPPVASAAITAVRGCASSAHYVAGR